VSAGKHPQTSGKDQCGITLGKGALPETFEKGGSMFHIRNDNWIKAKQNS